MTKVSVLDSTVHKTHEWLRDIKDGLGFDDDRAAYAALRATLHGLRDLLTTDEVAHLGAQLPMLVRGLYYEGWDPSSPSRKNREAKDFLEAVRRELHEPLELRDVERVARVVFRIVAAHVTPGETEKIVHSLPREIRALWSQPSPQDVA